MSVQPQRYQTLDGLRGVAAIAVLLYHADLGGRSLLSSGYLAVDLFFLLSGFVIDRTYRARLAEGLLLRAFFLRRLIRLYPSYLIGMALPTAMIVWALARGGPPGLAADVIAGLPNWFMLPSLPGTRGDGQWLFIFNGAYWSVFAELAVNALYATVLFRIGRKGLVVLAAVFAVKLGISLIAAGSANVGSLWSMAPFGLLRALSAFLIGAVLARLPLPQRRSASADLLLLALPAFALAYSGNTAAGDMIAIFGVFPALVAAGAQVQPRLPHLHEVLGRISYPLYCLHMPVLMAEGTAIAAWHLDPRLVTAITIPGLIALAYAVDRLWDGPVRAAATRLLLRPGAEAARRPAVAEALG